MTGAGVRASAARGGGGGVDGTDREHPIVTAAAASSATLLAQMTGRRQKLPVPKTETEGINLWNLGRHSRHSNWVHEVVRSVCPYREGPSTAD